jgi:hypothetical protein
MLTMEMARPEVGSSVFAESRATIRVMSFRRPRRSPVASRSKCRRDVESRADVELLMI